MTTQKKPGELAWTGERYIPNIEGDIRLEHMHRYSMAVQFAKNKTVLDIACGEGYGADMLARNARHVIGIDISKETISHASAKYGDKRKDFIVGSCAEIPLQNETIELIVCFETIEHHDQHEEMLQEFQRVLLPNGLVIISSPDKHIYSDAEDADNQFHVKELYRNQFEKLVSRYFKHIQIYGQRVIYGSGIFSEKEPGKYISFDDEDIRKDLGSDGIPRPLYNIIVASNDVLPQAVCGIFELPLWKSDIVRSLSDDKNRLIRYSETLKSEKEKVTTERNQAIHEKIWSIYERDQANSDKMQAIGERDQAINKQKLAVKWRDQAINERELAINERKLAVKWRDQAIKEQKQAINERDQALAWYNEAINERNQVINERNQIINERNQTLLEKDQIHHEYDRIHAEMMNLYRSKSWRLTAPLRSLLKYLHIWYGFFRRCLSKTSHFIWRFLPLPAILKTYLKNFLFRALPFLFKHTIVYHNWQAHQKALAFKRLSGNDAIETFEETEAIPYIPLLESDPLENPPVRLLSFYLPQFHPIPENDRWWEKGFSEWFNVVRGTPQFAGHYQPRLPGELGYYDLRIPDIQLRQVALAKLYGLGGFCFYFYWFCGKRLLEMPIQQYIDNSEIDFPFCLCWANENWSKRWDGLDNEILIQQECSPKDDLDFIAYVSRYLKDPRYIRFDNKPLLIVYRPTLLPSPKITADRWREWCQKNGIGEIFLAYTQSFESVDPKEYGFDAAIEFPPNNSHPPLITDLAKGKHADFKGKIFDWNFLLNNSSQYAEPEYTLFRGICPTWDNTARRLHEATIFVGSTPDKYKKWMMNAVFDTISRFNKETDRLIFINAWNEWAEGAYLEPDQKYGYAYLQATRDALENVRARMVEKNK